jgi:hypothetical protein
LQQRAERRKGQEAAAAYEQAVGAYRAALAAGLAAEQQADAHFGVAESLQMWGEALLEAAAKLPDEQLSAAAEQQASSSACELFRQAVEAYQQVGGRWGVLWTGGRAGRGGAGGGVPGELQGHAGRWPGTAKSCGAARCAGARGRRQQPGGCAGQRGQHTVQLGAAAAAAEPAAATAGAAADGAGGAGVSVSRGQGGGRGGERLGWGCGRQLVGSRC